ncbi:MAG: iron-containing alcohol dehydrogenase family protein [Planctomycetia bacterium]|nr:iron-containing alcohol dehydrogenase family protein [Planctomycetia bacterium]
MLKPTQIAIPTLVRVKAGALDRLGIYLRRNEHFKVAVLQSQGLNATLSDRVRRSLADQSIEIAALIDVAQNDLESAARWFTDLPPDIAAIVGVGGGKALDIAKYVGFLSRKPYYAVPTSLSNDGFCSPQSSLTIRDKRRSLPAALPFAVVIDTAVCQAAPTALTLSGVGDLVAKFTAVADWKLSFHATDEPVNDFAALLSDGSIHAYLSHPALDLEGIRLLATSLMLNGIAMELSGSSRPASGSEHLISHALDMISARPRLHGLQVGVACYVVSQLQQENTARIAGLFDAVGFWDAIASDPFSRREWLEAVRIAPSLKSGFYTILSSRDAVPEVDRILRQDPRLERCFQD